MYQLTYWQDNKPIPYGYFFQSLWAAVFKARAITESHGFPTDVMSSTTGTIMVEFQSGSQKAIYINSDIPNDVKLLALAPLE